MPYVDDLPEFTFESATQSDEELNAVVQKLGFEIETPATEEKAAEEPPAVQAAETAPATEEEAEEEAAEPATAAPKAEHGKSRAAKTREQLRETRTQLALLKTEFEELKKQQGARPGTPPVTETPKPAAEPPKPTAEVAAKPKPVYDDTKHASYEDFLEDLTDWKLEDKERQAAERKRQAEEAEQRTKQERAESDAQSRARAEEEAQRTRWNSNVAVAEARFPDWKAIMSAPRERDHEAVVAAVLQRDDVNSAELAYFLTRNPEKAKELNTLANSLGKEPTQGQIRQVMRKLDRLLDPIVVELESYEPEDEAEEAETPAPATQSTPVQQSAAATAPNAAKQPPQQPPPGSASAPAAVPAPAKPKPQVPSPVGGRGSTRPLSAMERASKGERVDPDEIRREWEAKHGGVVLR